MRRAIGLVLLSLVSACGAGSAGKAVQPQSLTAKDAMGGAEAPKCSAVAAHAEPLVVDWKSSDRVDLEAGMRAGVVVVTYDCSGLKLVKSCALGGTYAFTGVSRKEDAFQLTNADEVRANLPLGALKLSGEVARGSSLDLALVLVGKTSTTLVQATRSDLGGSCAGATHFVRAATIGAFAMSTGTVGKARAVADLFQTSASGASSSEQKTSTRDGDLAACRQATIDAAEPPAQCRTALRLELEPILEAQPANEPPQLRAFDNPCGPGFVWSQGRCTTKGDAGAHLCAPEDVVDCSAQCEKGSAESCWSAALGYIAGHSVKVDMRRAGDFVERGCALGDALACGKLGDLLMSGDGRPEDPKKGVELQAKGCEMGSGRWCSALATIYAYGAKTIPKDTKRAQALLLRGCDLGEAGACGGLGDTLVSGEWTTKDVAKGVALYKRACSAGGAVGPTYCVNAGDHLRDGRGAPRDPARAVAEYLRGCVAVSSNRDAGKACTRAAQMLRDGTGGPKDPARALQLFDRGCAVTSPGGAMGDSEACMALGETYERGTGVAVDLKRAASAYATACKVDVKSCRRYAEMLERGRGVPKDLKLAKDNYANACAAKDDAACVAEKRLAR
jgi:TPR repeat protein